MEDLAGDARPKVRMADWINLFQTVSMALCRHEDECEFMVYPAREGRPRIREPEARHAMTQSLREQGIRYGIEVPTKGKYRISGKKPDTANTDLVIDPDHRHIGVEFKCSQPPVKSILKDIEKFKGEPFGGVAFFHILQNSDSGSLRSLLAKYSSAFEASRPTIDRGGKELLLWILVKEQKKAYWKLYDSIDRTDITSFDPAQLHPVELREAGLSNPASLSE